VIESNTSLRGRAQNSEGGALTQPLLSRPTIKHGPTVMVLATDTHIES
jgi:hypothetical protein